MITDNAVREYLKRNDAKADYLIKQSVLPDGTLGAPQIVRWESTIPQPTEQDLVGLDDAVRQRENLLAQLQALDAQITNRRLTEALLTDEGKAWLQNIETQKEALRQQLRELNNA